MKSRIIFLVIALIGILFSTTACSIEGEAICGVWNANSTLGKTKLEITPWQGKFHGYLLAFDDGKQTIQGAKEDDYIFLSDLVYENGQYNNGQIFIDQTGKQKCAITLALMNKNELKAIYNCDGQAYEEVWTREGFAPNLVEKQSLKATTTNAKTVAATTAKSKNNTLAKNNKTTSSTPTTPTKTKPKTIAKKTAPTAKKVDANKHLANTKTQANFYVIGIHQTVDYNDMNGMGTAVENLWNKIYSEDFSSQLNNISDQERMYLVYGDYENPAGKMTITIGYKVSNLNTIPQGLNGVKVPSNEYLVYPLSGDASDYEGEGWDQLETLMSYRKTNSADFEVYRFDNNYKVTDANIWIATK